MWIEIAQRISQATNQTFEVNECRSISGGCINQAYRIGDTRRRQYFIKLNRLDLLDMFVAEAKGLLEIAATQTITVPMPICWGTVTDRSYLARQTGIPTPYRFGWCGMRGVLGGEPA